MRSFPKLLFIACVSFSVPVGAQSVEKILKRYYKAIGGEEKIGRLRSSAISSHVYSTPHPVFSAGLLFSTNQETATKEETNLYPYFQKTKTISPFGEYLHINNEHAWYSISLGRYANSTKSKPSRRCSVHPALHIKLLYEKGELSVDRDTIISGHRCQTIRHHSSHNPERFYFRKTDGLLYAMGNPQARHFSIFTNYREIEGILYPFDHEQIWGGSRRSLTQIDVIKFNVDLNPGDFAVDESKLIGLRDSKFLRSHIEFLSSDEQDLKLNALVQKHFSQKRLLICLWSSLNDDCKLLFQHYDGLLYSFLSDLEISFLFINMEEDSNESQWKQDVKRLNLNGYHLSADAGSILDNDLKGLFYKDTASTFPRYVLMDEKGNILSSRIPAPSGDTEFKSQVGELLRGN